MTQTATITAATEEKLEPAVASFKETARSIALDCREGLFLSAYEKVKSIIENHQQAAHELTHAVVEPDGNYFGALKKTFDNYFDFEKNDRRPGHFMIAEWPLNNIANYFKEHGNGHTELGKEYAATVDTIQGIGSHAHPDGHWDVKFTPRKKEASLLKV